MACCSAKLTTKLVDGESLLLGDQRIGPLARLDGLEFLVDLNVDVVDDQIDPEAVRAGFRDGKHRGRAGGDLTPSSVRRIQTP